MNAISKWMVAATCGLALTACGGGGGDNGITITASAGAGGTISPGTVKVNPGTTQAFTITPNSGYLIASVDGTCGGTLNGTTYTTSPINAACTVVASFSRTFTYEGLAPAANTLNSPGTDPTSFLALLNQEGAKGYHYLYDTRLTICTSEACPAIWSPPDLSLFVNDGLASSYAYELLPNPGNTADFIAQANAEGAKGYQYMAWTDVFAGGIPTAYALYRKDGSSTATYTYVAEVAGPMASVDAFVAQANARGQSGYYFYGHTRNADFAQANLYVKNNASKAIYTYTHDAEASVKPYIEYMTAIRDQLSSEGAKGYFPIYRLRPAIDIPADDPLTILYMKDQTQAATFTFHFQVPGGPSDVINLVNSYGAQGYSPWNIGIARYTLFFRATNCSGGWLCGVPNLPYSGQ